MAPRRLMMTALVITGLGYAFDGYNNSVFGLTLPWLSRSLHLTYADIGAIVAAFGLLYAIGAAVAGYLADRWGRRPMLTTTIGAYSLGALLTGLSGGVPMLTGSRAFSGLALGGEIPVGWAYMAEHTPHDLRGRFLGIQQAFWPLGYLFATLVVFMLAHQVFGVIPIGIAWRLAIWVGVLPALLLLWIRWRMRESAAWMNSGEEARTARTHHAPPVGQLLRRDLFPGLALASLLQITGTVVFASAMTWFPLLLVKVRHLSVGQMSTDLVLWVAAAFVGQIVSGWLSDRWGRRTVTIVFIAGQALCFLAFTRLANPAALLMAAPVVGFFVLGVWGVLSVWMNELFPTTVRATGLGVSATIGRLMNVLAPLMVGAIATQAGLETALLPLPALSLLTVGILLGWRHVPQFTATTQGEAVVAAVE